MSYPPFQPGSGNHPYPPAMSYPSAPAYPNNPGYPANPAYPPTSSPYPPSNAPYPSAGSSYPPSSSPYPPTSSPYPPTNSPYPPTNSPYPPSSSPYPPTNSPYPSGNSPYPPQASQQPGYSQYPPAPGQSMYPTLPSYPSQGSPHHGSGGQQSTYPLNTSSYPTTNQGYSATPVQHQQKNPTVRPFSPFNPAADAEALRKAMKGFGTDEAAIIAVLSRRTNQQRQEIARQYKSHYGKDLKKDLKGETSGEFRDLLMALMTPLHEYYAEELNHAITGLGTKESTLIEVLCALSNSEIELIKSTYQQMYSHPLEKDLAADTSGFFKRMLVSLCTARRDESMRVDMAAAQADAHALYRAGEKKFGTDEQVFNTILCTRNFAQLQAIFAEYEKLSGHPFEKAIQSEFSGDIEDGLLAIVKCARSRTGYLAERLHNSMSGAGTKDRALIRLMATRCEIDLGDIKQAFSAKYGKTLEAFIKDDTSGDYKKLLIALQT